MALINGIPTVSPWNALNPNYHAAFWSTQGSSSAGSVDSSEYNSPMQGLGITDTFGDELRELQEQAAQQQMEYQTQSAERAMQFSAEEAQKNRDFQEKMSSTAYQRAVKDLKAAGLNPILAAGGSSMASSTPAGATASGIAQTGSQAQVSEYNSALSALDIYLEAITSLVGSASQFSSQLLKKGK